MTDLIQRLRELYEKAFDESGTWYHRAELATKVMEALPGLLSAAEARPVSSDLVVRLRKLHADLTLSDGGECEATALYREAAEALEAAARAGWRPLNDPPPHSHIIDIAVRSVQTGERDVVCVFVSEGKFWRPNYPDEPAFHESYWQPYAWRERPLPPSLDLA